MQGAIYCGVPAANTAFKLTGDILRAEGRVPQPQPLSGGSRVAVHHTFSAPQIRVAVQGEGPPVVLSHALGLDLHMWDAFAARLAATHTVLRYDHRGHGGSARPPGPYEIDDLVDDAARVIREWGRGPVAWVGLSMGGMVGQGLAVRHPELLASAVFANTTSRYPEAARPVWTARIEAVQKRRHGGDRRCRGRALPACRAPGGASAAGRCAARRLLRTDPAGYAAACHAVAGVDWLERLATVKTPTLVIAGARDAGATPEMAQAIAERIPGASSRSSPTPRT
jgi:3-oxoadipate enol-lactonase